jgi:hypothetical protein
MKTLSASQITELHATRTTKGAGFAPSLAECLAAAADGRLYDVDTQNRGADCLTIAEHEALSARPERVARAEALIDRVLPDPSVPKGER